MQVADDGSLLFGASVPSCGYSVYDLVSRPAPPSGSELAVDESHLENSRLCVRWDETGLLTSVWDKSARREVLAPGSRGNVLQVFADYPNFYDAWDVDRFTLEHPVEVTTLDELAVTERGPQPRVRPHGPLLRGLPDHADDVPVGWLGPAGLRHHGGLGRVPPHAEGGVPRGRPVSARHLRDPVRPRRAAHARQHQLGPGPLRGVRPAVGGPVRSRLRGRPAQRLQVRLRHPGQRHAAVAPPGTGLARPAGRPRHTPLHVCPAAALGRPPRGSGRRDGLRAQRPPARA